MGNGGIGKEQQGATGKSKPAHECGDVDKYGRMTRKKSATDDAGKEFERDHIPSQGAMRRYAENYDDSLILDRVPKVKNGVPELNKNGSQKMTDGPFRTCVFGKIKRNGLAIATPKKMHHDFSQTCKYKNDLTTQLKDAADLEAAAKKDTAAMEEAMKKHGCEKKYKEAAEKVRQESASLNEKIEKYVDECKEKTGY